MCWCALMEAPFVLAAATSSSMAETARKFLPAMRAQLVVLYFSAAFWKLTSSWCEMQTRCRRDADEMQPRCGRLLEALLLPGRYDGHYSCSTVLMSVLLLSPRAAPPRRSSPVPPATPRNRSSSLASSPSE